MGRPSAPPPPPPPAIKPERKLAVEAEDLELGGSDKNSTKPKGKKALMRPSGNSTTSFTPSAGLKV